jgi:hypothetical protein
MWIRTSVGQVPEKPWRTRGAVLREDQVIVESNAKSTYCLTISLGIDGDAVADMAYPLSH